MPVCVPAVLLSYGAQLSLHITLTLMFFVAAPACTYCQVVDWVDYNVSAARKESHAFFRWQMLALWCLTWLPEACLLYLCMHVVSCSAYSARTHAAMPVTQCSAVTGLSPAFSAAQNTSHLAASSTAHIYSPCSQPQDVLGHPATRLLVSHCGLHSIYEAAFHGVPVVGLPFMFEQVRAAATASELHQGIVVSTTSMHCGWSDV